MLNWGGGIMKQSKDPGQVEGGVAVGGGLRERGGGFRDVS